MCISITAPVCIGVLNLVPVLLA